MMRVQASASTSSSASGRGSARDGLSSRWPGKKQVKVYRGLRADDFRHPLDQQNTQVLRLLPGADLIAKNLIGPVAEQVLLLENIGTSVKVGENQLPSLHSLLVEATTILGLSTTPELYIKQSSSPNAYTLAIPGRRPFIVMTTALIELLTLDEIQAVISHELGHLKSEHGVWLTAANILGSGAAAIPLISDVIEENILRWLRSAELSCDRAALLVVQDPKIVISALMKLAGGSPSFAHELNVDAFLQQARSYDEITSAPLGYYLKNLQTKPLSHPLPVLRARELDRFAQSSTYQNLIDRNTAALSVAPGAGDGGVPVTLPSGPSV